MGSTKRLVVRILLVALMMIVIIVAMALFFFLNRKNVIEQTSEYILAMNQEAVNRVNDYLELSENSLDSVAYVLSLGLEENRSLSSEEITYLFRSMDFSTIIYVDRNGMAVDSSGNIYDFSERPVYVRGIKGEAGAIPVVDSVVSNEPCLEVYKPVIDEGNVIGILVGLIGQEVMSDYIHSTLFGFPAYSSIISSDGDVIASIQTSTIGRNYFDILVEEGYVKQKTIEAFENAADSDEPYLATYETDDGIPVSISMLPTSFEKVFFVQAFPAEATRLMISNANKIGLLLELVLIFVFLLYILYLFVSYQRQRAQLEKEKNDVLVYAKTTEIQKNRYGESLNAMARSYNLIVYINTEDKRYQIIYPERFEGVDKEGDYEDLVPHLFDRDLIPDDIELEAINDFFDLERVVSVLETSENSALRYRMYIGGKDVPEFVNAAFVTGKRNKNGTPSVVVLGIRSIDEATRKDMAQRELLRSSIERAESASQAKTKFLSSMSHDIRTPMNAITGMTAIATMHIDDKARVLDCLSKINTASKQLLSLINDVLDMSRIESGKIVLNEEEFNLPDEVDGILTVYKEQMNMKGVRFTLNMLNIEHESVKGDPTRLSQILSNIIGNAVKFTPSGGEIKFQVSESPTQRESVYNYKFAIEDNGIGMSPEFIKHAFEPFARSEESQKLRIEGTGLGLPIAHNIAHIMGGDIKIESELGKGSKFIVTIPFKANELSEVDYSSLFSLTVLIVDDDKNTCEYEKELLDSVGMVSEYVLSGEEAVEKVEKHFNNGSMYSVVVLDWLMPGMNGIETAREIRKIAGKDVPIIFLTTYDFAEIEKEAREAGVDAFIAKPLFKSRFLGAMNEAISKIPHKEHKSEIDLIQEKSFVGKRILLAEDNALNAEIATELLTTAGFEVEWAENGMMAIERLKMSTPGFYDLVLMDIQMPVMDGYEATKIIRGLEREDLKNITIIAMSANTFKEDVEKAKKAGMNGHVGKPIQIDRLLVVLRAFA